MNQILKVSALIVAVLSLQACVVAPPQPVVYRQAPVVVQPAPVATVTPMVPQGVVYVAPTYPAPGVGFVWEFHPRFGWGWRHPQHGWHRGWQ